MMLELAGLHKRYETPEGTVTVLDGASLCVAAGETVALTGESGSGKSTLLHLAGGLESASAGSVRVGGVELGGLGDAARAAVRRDRIGLVFQQFNLVPSLTVAGNLAFQARLAGRHDRGWLSELVRRLGLEGLENRYPEALSGGQQQRVAIGRALAVRPGLVLADEPTGNLDRETGDAVAGLLLGLAAETGAAVLTVTHSDRLAARMGRRVVLSRGRIVEPGP